MRKLALILLFSRVCIAQTASGGPEGLLARRYKAGEALAYHMKGTNHGQNSTLRYEADATGTVKKHPSGFFEEYQWTKLSFNDQPVQIPAGEAARQQLSLDPAVPPSLPDFSRVDRRLIGPMADLLTFYADLWMAIKQRTLTHAGDRAYVKHGTPNSWADGVHTILGQDSIDFDLTLAEVNKDWAKLVVRHVPPAQPQIKVPVKWMSTPVADTENNWMEVSKAENGSYHAEVGKETFDVEMIMNLADGRILSASMDNPVVVMARDCTDTALTQCGDVVRYEIRRQISVQAGP
jgi:hypothetical protein